MKDATELAQEYERREERHRSMSPGNAPVVWGTLSIWRSLHIVNAGEDPWWQSEEVNVDLSRPGTIITYDKNGDAEVFFPEPGWYVNFVPDRHEGE